jgi:hypothetical protein
MALIERLWNSSDRNINHYQDFPIYYAIVECRNGNRAFTSLYEAYRHIKRNRSTFCHLAICYDSSAIGKMGNWGNFVSALIDKGWGNADGTWGTWNSYGETEDKVREQLRAYKCEFDYKPAMCNKKSWKTGF